MKDQLIQPNWDAKNNIRAYTTTKHSLATMLESVPSQHATEELMTLCQLPAPPCWLKQVHGSRVVQADPSCYPEADAAITEQTNRVCAILSADCLPVLVCNQAGTQVAAIHAGWRGLSKNIIITTLKQFHCPPNELRVWLGPAIGPDKFEVGLDVYQAFTQHKQIAKSAFHPLANNKWLANLYELAKQQCHEFGVSHVFGGSYCTYSQSDQFFSYRRDQSKTGRMASLIWITS